MNKCTWYLIRYPSRQKPLMFSHCISYLKTNNVLNFRGGAVLRKFRIKTITKSGSSRRISSWEMMVRTRHGRVAWQTDGGTLAYALDYIEIETSLSALIYESRSVKFDFKYSPKGPITYPAVIGINIEGFVVERVISKTIHHVVWFNNNHL